MATQKDDWTYDISKLKGYVIEESHFSDSLNGTLIKELITCIFKADSEEETKKCSQRTPKIMRITYADEPALRNVISSGDSRCSGKSEILHLMFPIQMRGIEVGREEEQGPFRSVHSPYPEPRNDSLMIYVKRIPKEREKCLIANRGCLKKGCRTNNYDLLPDELQEEGTESRERNRSTILPDIYKHPNYIILNNTNIEPEPEIDPEVVCNICDKRIESTINELKSNTEFDLLERYIKQKPGQPSRIAESIIQSAENAITKTERKYTELKHRCIKHKCFKPSHKTKFSNSIKHAIHETEVHSEQYHSQLVE